MGVKCYSEKNRKNNRALEREIPDSELIKVKMDLINVIPSTCKINSDHFTGTGCFKKLKGINYLMTNEHVVSRQNG